MSIGKKLKLIFGGVALSAVFFAPDVAAQAEPEKDVPAPCAQTAPKEKTATTDFQKRIVRLYGGVNEDSANRITAQLRDLDEIDPGKPITMHINSGGGGVMDGLRIHDTMKSLRSPVNTVCDGFCASMAAVLLASGTRRSALPNATIMIHELSGGTGGKYSEMRSQQKFIERQELQLLTILSENSGLSIEKLTDMVRTDMFLTPAQAKDLRLIDEVRKPVQPPPRYRSEKTLRP